MQEMRKTKRPSVSTEIALSSAVHPNVSIDAPGNPSLAQVRLAIRSRLHFQHLEYLALTNC